MRGMDPFKIDKYGLAFIIKLVEKRVNNDIENVRKKLETDKVNNHVIKPGIKGKILDSYENLKENYDHWRDDKLQQELDLKNQWLKLWSIEAWETLADHQELKQQSIEEVRNSFLSNSENKSKLFLILQEAVLTPVYCKLPTFSKSLSERDTELGIEIIAKECGFLGEIGKSILKNTDKFLKEVNNHWGKVIKWTLAGTGAAILTAGLAAPIIAGAIGTTLGLSGAAATSAGLATIGGGAIAAGGLGMAGGMQILIGGGALLGAVGGGSVAKVISKLPKDAVAVSMAKLVNYITYLRATFGDDHPEKSELVDQIISTFLYFKHMTETDFLLYYKPSKESENVKKAIDIMHFTYRKLLRT